MLLKDKLMQDLKQAMKEGQAVKTSQIRLLRSEIKNKEIEIRKPLDDEGVYQLLRKMVKRHQESIEQFGKGGRPDLVQKEKEELKILEPYLPKLMEGEVLKNKIKAIVQQLGVNSQMGQVMKEVGNQLKGQVDMKQVSEIVKTLLSS